MSFTNLYRHEPALREDCLCFLFRASELLVHEGSHGVPLCGEIGGRATNHRQQFGTFKGSPVCVALGPPEPPVGFTYVHLRGLYGMVADDLLWLAGRGYQVMEWDRTTQYCGVCGSRTERDPAERAKLCPSCGFRQYPRVAPAMIVAVVRDGRLLLAQSVRYRGNRYSVLAGFVEPGETLEECVRREVFEETRIEVTNLRYFDSQSWPFPHSLMVAFTAEYAAGEILVDKTELRHAYWCKPDELPEVPSRMSVSRRLIDWFVETYRD